MNTISELNNFLSSVNMMKSLESLTQDKISLWEDIAKEDVSRYNALETMIKEAAPHAFNQRTLPFLG